MIDRRAVVDAYRSHFPFHPAVPWWLCLLITACAGAGALALVWALWQLAAFVGVPGVGHWP